MEQREIIDEMINELNTSIKNYIGAQESECSCNQCKSMCTVAPCLGTPLDIINYIELGLVDKLEASLWLAGIINGIEPIEMIQFKYEDGKCIMFENGLCSIHQHKPLEGKLAIHNIKSISHYKNGISPSSAVALTWQNVHLEHATNSAFLLFEHLKTNTNEK